MREGRRFTVEVVADGDDQTVGHVGAGLLAVTADRLGMTGALSDGLAGLRSRRGGYDPGRVVRDLAVVLADGGDCLADLRGLRDQGALFGAVASDATAYRVLDAIAERGLLDALAAGRAAMIERAFAAGARPDGPLVIDIDATLITSEDVRIVVELRRRSPVGWWSDGNGLGDLVAVGVLGGGEEGVAFDGDDERGEVAVADDLAELLLGDEHAGGGPALAHVAVVPALDVALGVADDLNHALARVSRGERLRELSGAVEPVALLAPRGSVQGRGPGQPSDLRVVAEPADAWARRCRLAPFVKLARTITKQRAGITAAIENGLSNARVEAINTQIRMITRRAFGFHSADAPIALAMLSLVGLCPTLPR